MEEKEKSFKELVFDLMNGYYEMDCYTGPVPKEVENEFNQMIVCAANGTKMYTRRKRGCAAD